MGHFNVSNLEMLKAVSHVAEKLDLAVIVGTSLGEREYLGVHHIVGLIRIYNSEHSKKGNYRLFLNADHSYSLEKVEEAAEAGYDMIVFDGSKLPFKENIAQTKKAVELVKKINPNILVEGELGYIGSSSKILDKVPQGAVIKEEDLPSPDQALRFVKETGVDMLAPAVGNIHGMFKNFSNPALNIKRIRSIKEAVKIPLVLHGGSGVSNDDFKSAIKAGISIIHISTEMRLTWRDSLAYSLTKAKEENEVAPYRIISGTIEALEKVIEEKLRVFNG